MMKKLLKILAVFLALGATLALLLSQTGNCPYCKGAGDWED